MKTYRSFATTLEALLASDQAVRITVGGYMPLSVERIGRSGDGNILIAISHTATQNGDLMRDPELVFEIHEHGCIGRLAEPISFRNDFVGLLQEACQYDDQGRRKDVYPRLRRELDSFARLWFRNLREQGFLSDAACREILA